MVFVTFGVLSEYVRASVRVQISQPNITMLRTDPFTDTQISSTQYLTAETVASITEDDPGVQSERASHHAPG